jgi:hypothetical protein
MAEQLKFEGYDVEDVATKFRGTVELDGLGVLQPYEKVRLEVDAQVIDIRHPDQDGSLRRVQILKALTATRIGP